MTENGIKNAINLSENLESCEVSLIYSISTNDTIIKELTTMSKAICNTKPGKELKISKLTKAYFQEEMRSVSKFDCYVLEASNKKKYTVKIFNLNECDPFPSGMSTAYLNYRNGFESYGYLGRFHSFRLCFICIEESTSLYISTNNFSAFIRGSNEKQALYYIINLLELLKTLNIYRIKLNSHKLIFAVDDRNSNIWRFRLDHIGYFHYFVYVNGYENHTYLVSAIDKLLNSLKNSDILNFFEEFIVIMNDLEESKNKDYIKTLLDMLENKIMDVQYMNVVKMDACCIIQ